MRNRQPDDENRMSPPLPLTRTGPWAHAVDVRVRRRVGCYRGGGQRLRWRRTREKTRRMLARLAGTVTLATVRLRGDNSARLTYHLAGTGRRGRSVVQGACSTGQPRSRGEERCVLVVKYGRASQRSRRTVHSRSEALGELVPEKENGALA